MYYNKEELKTKLKLVLLDLANYIYKYRIVQDKKQIKGEFFTMLRRHLPQLVNVSRHNAITTKNIEDIHYDLNTGELLYLRFISNYGACTCKETIKMLNDLISELNIDFKKYSFEKSIDDPINAIKNFKVQC